MERLAVAYTVSSPTPDPPPLQGVECMCRRWTGPDELDCRHVRTLLCFESIASGRVPDCQEDGSRSRIHVFKVSGFPRLESC